MQEWEGDSDDSDHGPDASAETVSEQQEQQDPPEQQHKQPRRQAARLKDGKEALSIHKEEAVSGLRRAPADVPATDAAVAEVVDIAAEGGLVCKNGAHCLMALFDPACCQ